MPSSAFASASAPPSPLSGEAPEGLRPKPRDPFVRALVRDAAKSVEKRHCARLPLAPAARLALALPALLIAAALSFVPQLNWFVTAVRARQAKLCR